MLRVFPLMETVAPGDILGREDYRAVLREELERRQEKNPRYSLRAFARSLEIGPNRLSEILNGKQGLSAAYAKRIARNLGYGPLDSRYFCEIVRATHGRGARERERARDRAQELRREIAYHRLSIDAFRLIADWHHLAIVELSKLKSFQPRSAWIAKKLGIPATEVKEALNRLERVGLLDRKGGAFRFVENNAVPAVPAESIRKFHEGVLGRASAALWGQDPKEREFSTTLVALDKAALPQIRERIAKLWKGIDRDFGAKGDAQGIYALGVQCFALTEAGHE